MREKIIEQLVWNDIDTMIKDAENGDFWYFSEVLKNRSPYKEWSDDELLNELKERELTYNEEAIA
jgi:hypothetical protein